MDASSDLFDFLDNFEELDRRRERIIRDRRNDFVLLDDIDFKCRYRMKKETVLKVLEEVEGDLEYNSDRNNSLSAIIQLLITIRFYATGAYLRAIGDIYGADVATISRIVKKVTTALSKLRAKYIMFPESESEQIKNQAEFYKIGGFPYVLGAIDCTHIKIQSPGGNDPELFRNRKGYFSLNVQTVSDANLKIISIVTRWAGSTHDSSIFTNSRLCAKFESGQYGSGILLGDSGYGLKNYLLTPYLNPRTRAQEAYNRSHILTRNTVERQYGLLKRRFPILALGLRLALESSINVVISCKAKKRLNFKIYKREFQALL